MDATRSGMVKASCMHFCHEHEFVYGYVLQSTASWTDASSIIAPSSIPFRIL